jgi:hypothetical protein
MSFKTKVKQIGALQNSWEPGIQALSPTDRGRVDSSKVKLLGSVALDDALQNSLPNAARWDYLVVTLRSKTETAHWIEVHPASGHSTIGHIEAKLSWLQYWIRQNDLDGNPKRFIWIATGKSSFNSLHPKIKALARKGVQFSGRHHTLRNL